MSHSIIGQNKEDGLQLLEHSRSCTGLLRLSGKIE